MKIIAVMVLLAASAWGQNDDWKTHSLANGRAWVTLHQTTKEWFVWGFQEGMSASLGEVAGGNGCKPPDNSIYRPEGMKIAEIVAGIDDFYKDAANARIPVALAMSFFVEKVRGATPERLEALMASLRKAVAKSQ